MALLLAACLTTTGNFLEVGPVPLMCPLPGYDWGVEDVGCEAIWPEIPTCTAVLVDAATGQCLGPAACEVLLTTASCVAGHCVIDGQAYIRDVYWARAEDPP